MCLRPEDQNIDKPTSVSAVKHTRFVARHEGWSDLPSGEPDCYFRFHGYKDEQWVSVILHVEGIGALANGLQPLVDSP